MDYSASSSSISGGAGGKMNGWDAKEGTTAPRGGPGMPMSERGSDSSSTLATLTEGNITIGGKQTTAAELGINTDASAAHRALEALPDVGKLLADQQAMAAAAGTVVSVDQQIRGEINRSMDEAKQRKEDAKLSAAVIAGSSEGAQKRALAAAAKVKGSRDAGLVESPIAGCEIWSRCKGNTANTEIDRIYGVLRPVAPVVDWSKLVVPVEWNRG